MTAPSKTSGEKTADAIIATGKAIITGVNLISNETNDPRVIIYDGVTAAGNKLFEASLDVSIEGFARYYTFEGGVKCNTGIYVDVNGTGASYIIHFK